MKKFLVMALLGLPVWAASQQTASAWGRFHIGVGLDCSWACGCTPCCTPCCPPPCYPAPCDCWGCGPAPAYGYGGGYGYGYGADYGYPVGGPDAYGLAQGPAAYGQDYQAADYSAPNYYPAATSGYGW